jgi:hypothetical protein
VALGDIVLSRPVQDDLQVSGAPAFSGTVSSPALALCIAARNARSIFYAAPAVVIGCPPAANEGEKVH